MRLKMAEACLDGKRIEFDKPKKLAKLVKACSAELLEAAE